MLNFFKEKIIKGANPFNMINLEKINFLDKFNSKKKVIKKINFNLD